MRPGSGSSRPPAWSSFAFLIVGASAARSGVLIIVLWEGMNALLFGAFFLAVLPRRIGRRVAAP